MARKGKKKKPAGSFNKNSLSNAILGIYTNNPTQTLNYKQLAKRLEVKDNSQKRMINQVLLSSPEILCRSRS